MFSVSKAYKIILPNTADTKAGCIQDINIKIGGLVAKVIKDSSKWLFWLVCGEPIQKQHMIWSSHTSRSLLFHPANNFLIDAQPINSNDSNYVCVRTAPIVSESTHIR